VHLRLLLGIAMRFKCENGTCQCPHALSVLCLGLSPFKSACDLFNSRTTCPTASDSAWQVHSTKSTEEKVFRRHVEAKLEVKSQSQRTSLMVLATSMPKLCAMKPCLRNRGRPEQIGTRTKPTNINNLFNTSANHYQSKSHSMSPGYKDTDIKTKQIPSGGRYLKTCHILRPAVTSTIQW
jgi:hypothetical protein